MNQHLVQRPLSMFSSIALSTVVMILLLTLAIPFAKTARAATTWDVSIVSFDFQPDSIDIMPGDSVRWTNNAAINHDVTEASDAWTSGIIAPGETFTRTFDTIGDVNYVCALHAGMTGVVHVGTEIPEFSATFFVVLGMLGLVVGMIVIRKKR